MSIGETQIRRSESEETMRIRDAFAVIFFVSVGMLVDPAVVIEQPSPLLATVAIIMLGKSIAAFLIVRAFGYSSKRALTIAASLAQIGEFSFIIAVIGTELGMLPHEGRDLIIAGTIISIFLHPRSEERRGGKDCVSPCCICWAPWNKKKKRKHHVHYILS